jgi:hypothetical protein
LFIQLVSGGNSQVPPSFAYTVGLFGLGHPELVVLTTGSQTSGGLLNHLGERTAPARTSYRAVCSPSTTGHIGSSSRSCPTRGRSCSPLTGITSGRPRLRCPPTS